MLLLLQHSAKEKVALAAWFSSCGVTKFSPFFSGHTYTIIITGQLSYSSIRCTSHTSTHIHITHHTYCIHNMHDATFAYKKLTLLPSLPFLSPLLISFTLSRAGTHSTLSFKSQTFISNTFNHDHKVSSPKPFIHSCCFSTAPTTTYCSHSQAYPS